MRYLSVCSGIEAASVAWHPLGWVPVAFSEVDPFPCALLAARYPYVPNLGDLTRYEEWPDATVDVLVGGTPCQGFSVAGLRGGMADPRSRLTYAFAGVAARYRPEWVVWENVPGVFSSGDGRDLAGFIQGLGELGYSCAWRVLDAQYFGVPQRRRRVFVVGHLGDWRRAAAVLFERESLRGYPAPRRETRENVAPSLAARTKGGGGLGTDFDCDGGLIAFGGNNTAGPIDVATACNAHGGPTGRMDFESETFIAFDTTQVTHAANRSNPQPGDPCHPLASGAHAPAIAFHNRQDPDVSGNVTHPLGAKDNGLGLGLGMMVRRLTPRECERLQGFPDDWTAITYRGKPAADGPRYKALGNSMAVPVMRWLGERIAMVAAHG